MWWLSNGSIIKFSGVSTGGEYVGQPMAEERCGTCRWYRPSTLVTGPEWMVRLMKGTTGTCAWEAPEHLEVPPWYRIHYDDVEWVHATDDGGDCPCWEAPA